jgi:hypothetical protein
MKNKILIFITGIIIIAIGIVAFSSNKEDDGNIVIEKGEHFFEDGLTILEGETLVIEPGAVLLMGENARIEVNGKIFATGTEENPITFKSAGNYYWRGVKINGKNDELELDKYWNIFNGTIENVDIDIALDNIFNYCYFSDISNEENKWASENKWIGTIEGYSTSLGVSNSIFDNIKYIGGVVTQGSLSIIKDNQFLDNDIHKPINHTFGSVSMVYRNTIEASRTENQTCADGVWINDSVAIVYANNISGVGDDGIDSSHSRMIVVGNDVSHTQDEGIDIDDSGNAIIVNNKIDTVRQNGILISRGSEVIIYNNDVKNADYGLTLRNGGVAFVDQLKLSNNNYGIVYYNTIPCMLTREDFATTRNYVLNSNETNCEIGKIERTIIALDNAYTSEGDYYVYNKELFDRDVDEAFEIYSIFNIDINKNNSVEFCKNNNLNKLYAKDITLVDNGQDYLDFNNYNKVDNEWSADCESSLCQFSNQTKIDDLLNHIEYITNLIDNIIQ